MKDSEDYPALGLSGYYHICFSLPYMPTVIMPQGLLKALCLYVYQEVDHGADQ